MVCALTAWSGGAFSSDEIPVGGLRLTIRPACGGGAIFNIVGRTSIPVGRVLRANNVEGGSSREARSETDRGRGASDTMTVRRMR